jgi:hypothetical protein
MYFFGLLYSNMSQRYSRVPIKLTAKQLAKLNGAPHGSPMSFVLGGSGEEITVLVAPSQAKKLAEGGKRIKFSAAAIKKMRGAGILTEVGKTAASTVQGIVDQFDPSSKLADRAADLILEATEVVERGLQGKKPVDYSQVAAQHNRAVDKAKQWTSADQATRKKAFANRQKQISSAKSPASRQLANLLGSTEEQYTANMQKIAAQPKQSAKSAKEARYKRLRGDTKTSEIGKQLAAAATEKLVEKVPVVGDVLSVAKTVKEMRGGRGRTGKHMRRPMYGLGVMGDTLGEQAANFIREELKKS